MYFTAEMGNTESFKMNNVVIARSNGTITLFSEDKEFLQDDMRDKLNEFNFSIHLFIKELKARTAVKIAINNRSGWPEPEASKIHIIEVKKFIARNGIIRRRYILCDTK
jgi:hypothetical protein